MKRDIAVLVLIINMVSTNNSKDISIIMDNMDILKYVSNKLNNALLKHLDKETTELIKVVNDNCIKHYNILKGRLKEVLKE